MQTRDHLALGRFLLEIAGSEALQKHRRAFLLGCVEPDYNMATYLRGGRRGRKLRGHNAENSLAHLSRCMAALQTEGLRSFWDYFTLGTMLHYAADAFTWPHNAFWEKSLAQHVAYEKTLHPVFAGALRRSAAGPEHIAPRAALAFFTGNHCAYSAAPHAMATDCRYIIGVCGGLLLAALCGAAPAESGESCWKEAAVYAGADHYGLV